MAMDIKTKPKPHFFSMEKLKMEPQKYHIMMLPWLAFGHMIPFLELSKKLASKGISISYISTPKNVQRLSPIPPNLSTKINFLEIPLPRVEGLPENCEATIDLQPEEIQYLKKAYDGLAEPFQKLLEEVKPDLILVDFAPYWVPEIASKLGVPIGFFSVYTAATLAYMGPPDELRWRSRPEHFTKPPEWVPFRSLVAYDPYYAPNMMLLHVPDASGVSSRQRSKKILEYCSFVLVKTCEEFEGEYISIVRDIFEKPVLPIGLLSPLLEEKNNNNTIATKNNSNTFNWLDSQRPKTVVFVGFGSEYKMPVKEIHELAYALELSKLPFLWVLRKPQKVDSDGLLPVGFTERTLSKGRVVLGWAPQLEILSHVAIGACLFHAGWGTIVESLGFGLPLIVLPMVADQGLNAKLLVEKEVGYEVPRNEDGSFSRGVVAESIRRVVVGPEGERLRLRAAEMRSVFEDKENQSNYINKFIEHLEKYHDLKGKN